MVWRKWILLLVISMLTLPVQAERVFRSVDEEGNVTYQSRPSYESGMEEREISGGYDPTEEAIALDRAIQNNPVTVYAIRKCKPCQRVRDRLKERKIPFTEKDPTKDKAVYREFMKLSVDNNVVPIIKVGDNVVREYTADALEQALDGAGYPQLRKEDAEEEEEGEEENEEEGEEQNEEEGEEEEESPAE